MTLNRLFQISWQQIPQFTVFVFDASFTNFRIHIEKSESRVSVVYYKLWTLSKYLWKMTGVNHFCSTDS